MIDKQTKQELDLFLKDHYSETRIMFCVRPNPDAKPPEPVKPAEKTDQPTVAFDEEIPFGEDDSEKTLGNKTSKPPKAKPDTKPKEQQAAPQPAGRNSNVLSQLKNYLVDSFIPKTFANQLLRLIKVKGLNEIDVYKAANIDRKLFSKIRHSDYHPSRKTAIALILAAHLSQEEATELLCLAGYALSRYEKADVIIEFCLTKQIYDLMLVNELLQEYTDSSL